MADEPQGARRPEREPAAVRRVLWVILVLNLLVAGAKGLYGMWSGSLAVRADAFHSLLDGAGNVVGLVAVRLAASAPDRNHPYGHRKIEVLASALVGLVIASGAARLGWSAIDAWQHGRPGLRVDAELLGVLVGTLVVNVFVAAYEHRRGRELGSTFLQADAAHTASDVWVTLGVLGSLLLTRAGFAWADPAAAVVVVAIVAWVAWRILSTNVRILLDEAPLDPDEVERIARSVAGVTDAHRIRSRGGPGAVHLDLHLQVDGDLSLARAHEIGHEVEDRLREALPGVVDATIHLEPDGDPPETD